MNELDAFITLLAAALSISVLFVQSWFLGGYLGKKIASIYLVWDCKKRFPEHPEIVKPYREHLNSYKRG
ncbi:MAG: hypothetical protein ACI8ZA_001577 [Gammaproteobacteria bacterium]|jgi:hypothetical protein